ncbi:MAG: M48 family metalloprotease [Nitrospirota bacterium]
MKIYAVKKHMPFYAVLVFLMIFISACAKNPVTGERELVLISEEDELSIGVKNYPITTQMNNGLFKDDELQAYVNAVGKRLGAESHRPNLPYEFNVVNASELNAFALPGGKISITRGLLINLENEDQLAGILGHEIGHATARHSAKHISRTVLTQAVLVSIEAVLAAKDIKNRELYSLGSTFAATLMLMKYSRDQERQSDHLGLDYINKAGYNPTGLKQSMEILQKAHKKEPSKLENLFMTHPLTTERIDAISKELNTTYKDTVIRELKADEFSRKTAHLKNLKNAYAHYDKGDEAMGKKDYKAAEGEYNKAIWLHKDAIFYSGLAFALLKQDKTGDAKTAIDASIKIEPNLFGSRFLSGLINYKSEKYQASLVHMLAADKLIPDVPQVKLYIARCYERLNNKEKSAEYYKETLKLDPNGEAGKEAREKLIKWGVIK